MPTLTSVIIAGSAGVVCILVGLSTLWMRITATKKEGEKVAADAADHRSSVDHRLETLEYWRGEHTERCSTDHAEMTREMRDGFADLRQLIAAEAREAKSDRSAVHGRINGLSEQMARLGGRFDEMHK